MDLYSSIKQRVPFNVYKLFASLRSLPTGHGYAGCFQAIEAISDREKKSEILVDLEKLYLESIIYCEKSLAIYECEESQLSRLRDIMPALEIEESEYSKNYPFYLDNDVLMGESSEPVLVTCFQEDSDWYLVYSSKRFFTERVDIDIEAIDDRFKEQYKEYQDLLAIRKNYRQFFDVVKVPANGNRIEVRVDSPGHMPKKEVDSAVNQMDQVLHSLFGYALRGGSPSLKRANFFPLIDELYKSTEGRICELSFITDTGGVKTSKMRRYEDDLRNEKYHKEGSKNVQITPYKIGIRWQLKKAKDVYSNPELFIAGRHAHLAQPSPVVDTVSVSKCLERADFEFILGVLEKYLS